MQREVDSTKPIAEAVLGLDLPGGRPPVVGVSGFGGAGKSTLAAKVAGHLAGAAVVPGDEFLRSRPPTERSDDWGDVDRVLLAEDVLAPLRAGRTASYRVYDPVRRGPGPRVSLVGATAVIVEGLGLFVPELVDLFDLRIWVDVDLDSATAQGMWRDEHEYGNPQTELWTRVWRPNDADFFTRFRPDRAADLLYRPPR